MATRLKSPFILSILIFLSWALLFYLKGNLTGPLVGDEADHINRGLQLSREGFAAFADGYRPPLFVLITSALSYILHDGDLIVGARLFNLALVSAIPGVWLYASKSDTTDRVMCALMAVFTSIWLPLFHYGAPAIAEGVSFFALNLLLIMTISFSSPKSLAKNIGKAFVCGFLIALLTLSKANNILVAPGCAIAAFFLIKSGLVGRVSICLVMALVAAILIFPWVAFLHHQSGEYKLTTTGGLNVLIGTGHNFIGNTDRLDPTALPDKYILSHFEFHQTPNGPSALSVEDEVSLAMAKNRFELDDIAKQIGIRIWKTYPAEQSIYASLKVLHSVGGSLRGGTDYALLLFAAITIVCSIFCLINNIHRPIISLHWLLAFAGFFVSFVFLQPIRFKTFYFDSSALLVISATLSFIMSRMCKASPYARASMFAESNTRQRNMSDLVR